MKTPEERIADLEHTNKLLHQKIQILELSVEIERKKREKAEQQTRNPYNPWGGATYNSSSWTTASAKIKEDVDQLVARINKAMKGGTSDPGSPPVS